MYIYLLEDIFPLDLLNGQEENFFHNCQRNHSVFPDKCEFYCTWSLLSCRESTYMLYSWTFQRGDEQITVIGPLKVIRSGVPIQFKTCLLSMTYDFCISALCIIHVIPNVSDTIMGMRPNMHNLLS